MMMVRLAFTRLLTENFRERSLVFAEFKSWLLCVVFLKIIHEYYSYPKECFFSPQEIGMLGNFEVTSVTKKTALVVHHSQIRVPPGVKSEFSEATQTGSSC